MSRVFKEDSRAMFTIVIGDGLTNEVMSPEHQYQSSHVNVGLREIARLLGKGKAYGEGPLPTFLRTACEFRAEGGKVGVVVLGAEASESPAGEFGDLVEPVGRLRSDIEIVTCSDDLIPWAELLEAGGRLTDQDLRAETSRENVRFLVVGCHTDRRIQALALLLRNVFGFSRVAVASHLVGSATQEAHFATLRHNLPASGVEVLLDLGEAAAYAGLSPADFTKFEAQPCAIEPEDVRDSLDEHQRRVVQLLCMHWTRTRLRPLGGGYSGSALYIADGWKGDARTEPMVLKIDAFAQMRRELDGYHQVKDFFGKHVPTFGYPVHESNVIGVGMELAAMEGRPETLQDTFEVAEDDKSANHFLSRFDKALELLANKLYGNTRESSWVVPYRAFALHTEKQVSYLRSNTETILKYLDEAESTADRVNVDQLVQIAKLIAANPDGIESEVCLVHGDLNYQNVICDAGENVWFIDWTHSGTLPVELDFAKLENDVKFVLTKTFELDDMERLKRFEEYLLSQRIPGDVDGLPDSLKFAKWDLRYRKILHAVRRIRQTLFDLKEGDSWLVYRVALLRYSTQTLSFDKRRDRGECDFPQLLYALYSSEALLMNLVADDFHLKIRSERPAEYPERQRISIDEAPWVLDCESYEPPYFVAESVLENDRLRISGGWADPEDTALMKEELLAREAKRRDDQGRPLNPRGRTGIAGRGLLGLWGSNLSVAATVVRKNAVSGQLDVLLGNREDGENLGLPKGFVLPGEEPKDAVTRVIGLEAGWKSCELSPIMLSDGYTYDPRQTDHAWVESRCYLPDASDNDVPDGFEPGGEFDEVKWWPLDAEVVNRVPSGQAQFIREAIARLAQLNTLTDADAETLLSGTG